MANPRVYHLCLLLLLLLAPLSAAQRRPKGLALSVTKDTATGQYVTRVDQRTPLVGVDLVLDLGSPYTWVDCESGYASTSSRPVRCRSAQCSLANNGNPDAACTGDGNCVLFPHNPFISTTTTGDARSDVLSLRSTDASTPGRLSFNATVPSFLFSCAPTFLLSGLAAGAKGVAALSRSRVAMPTQLASAFSLHRKFSICLSGRGAPGAVYLGEGVDKFLPSVNDPESFTYTPLLPGRVPLGWEPSNEYFIGVNSINVNGKPVAGVNPTLLAINSTDGVGGTKISTVKLYTTLETSIYKAVTAAFRKEAGVATVPPVAPFDVCFAEEDVVRGSRLGPDVPTIDLVMRQQQGGGEVGLPGWRMFGGNSMVRAKEGVWCLAFVDGGEEPRTSIVIGGQQLEDNLLQFDLATSTLGFTNTLLLRRTTCASFNFQ